ncbi:BnaC02g01310D [Brassica napus]|uniref:BnaC02g01310D protein n=1 Tax=Brassica napus TaxID=3708 RepID=A0A078I4F6_BRANA|nr:BnaC02g01310D [Brassica napus]
MERNQVKEMQEKLEEAKRLVAEKEMLIKSMQLDLSETKVNFSLLCFSRLLFFFLSSDLQMFFKCEFHIVLVSHFLGFVFGNVVLLWEGKKRK